MFEKPYELTASGMKRLANDLEYYANEYLPQKAEELVRRLAKLGLTEAQIRISDLPDRMGVTISCDISREAVDTSAMLMMIGPVKESEKYPPFYIALAVEFGTGITYNNDINPYALQLGYGPGTYGQGKGLDPGGWWYWKSYDNEDTDDGEVEGSSPKGELIHTYGMQARKPLYSATLEMQRQIADIAREVFNTK